MARLAGLRDKYLTLDPRGLGVGRIALAVVLLVDLARRAPLVTLWYTNLGLLPNHTVLWRPPFPYAFSLFFTASHRAEAAIGFALCGAAYLMLLAGLRTRLAQFASLVAVLSLHGRVLFVQNSGDVVLVELCIWTLFLPLGRRYSMDSLRSPPDRTPVVSFAALAIVAQLAAIYLLNAAQKNGVAWREGTAVHYVLYYANITTSLGAWVRGWVTPRASQVLTWSTRAVEGALPLLLLTPFGQQKARRLAIALIIGLHASFALFLNLGIFVPAMLAFTPFLVPASDWDAIEGWWTRRRFATHARAALTDALARLAEGDTPRRDATTGRRLARLREGTALALMAIATLGAVVDNPAATHVTASAEPRAVNALRISLQMFQFWGMFAPDVPLTEATVAVDAVTAEGRHVDPLSEALSPAHPWLGDSIPASLGYNSFASAYLLRLPGRPEYFTALGEWLLRYPERTGRDGDRITSFRVLGLEQDAPPPGTRDPRNPRTTILFHYPN